MWLRATQLRQQKTRICTTPAINRAPFVSMDGMGATAAGTNQKISDAQPHCAEIWGARCGVVIAILRVGVREVALSFATTVRSAAERAGVRRNMGLDLRPGITASRLGLLLHRSLIHRSASAGKRECKTPAYLLVPYTNHTDRTTHTDRSGSIGIAHTATTHTATRAVTVGHIVNVARKKGRMRAKQIVVSRTRNRETQECEEGHPEEVSWASYTTATYSKFQSV